MADTKLDALELDIAREAARIYRSPFHRYGRLAGWIGAGLVVCMLLPSMRRYQPVLAIAGTMLMFYWYRSVSTRALGKIVTALQTDHRAEVVLPTELSRRTPNRNKVPFIFYLVLSLIMAAETALFGHNPVMSGAYVYELFAADVVIGLGVGTAMMIIAYFIYFVMDDRTLSTLWLGIGIKIVWWGVIGLMLAIVFSGHATG